jgi:hypothetical protein
MDMSGESGGSYRGPPRLRMRRTKAMPTPLTRRRKSGKRQGQRRLSIDRLDDRLTPSTFNVNSLLDTASPPSGVTTLRSAIAAANADNNADPAHPDVINFSVGGTIAVESGLPPITGSLSVQGPGAGDLTLLGQNQTYGQTILTVKSPATATVSGLTLDGNSNQSSGIAVAGGALTLADVVVQRTYSAGNGGAIVETSGTVTVARSQFLNDIAGAGGAISNSGGTLTVGQSTFDHCYAIMSDGGAILDWAGPAGTNGGLTVAGCAFSNDSANNVGGGIALDAGGRATVVDSTFAADKADDGAAISMHITSYNTVDTVGLTLAGSTLANNSAYAGGALYVEPNAGSLVLTATLNDTIVAGNTGGDVNGSLDPTGGFNLIGVGTGMTGLTNGLNANQIGTATASINPLLGRLASNGGPVTTMALLPGSPAIDHGGPAPALDGLTTSDALGNPRVVSQSFALPPAGGDGRDIGAYELSAQTTPTVLTVNSLSDAAGAPAPGDLTLRQAVLAADGTVPLSELPSAQVQTRSLYVYRIQFSTIGAIALTSALPALGGNGGIVLQGPGRRH